MIELYNADCLEKMKDLKDKSIDMILTDLPYGITHCTWDNEIDLDKMWEQYERIIKDNGVICLFSQNKFFIKLVNSNPKLYRYDLIWDKVFSTGFLNANRQPLRSHEQIAIFYKKQPKYKPQFKQGKPLHGKGRKRTDTNNVYGNFDTTFDKRRGSTEKYPTSILKFSKLHPSQMIYPTEKPVELLEYLIKTYTDEGDIVLDSCMGSGSTGVACQNINRKFIGIEINRETFEIAKERINI